MFKKRKVLVVAAHPDDEVLGCGATVRRYVNEGCSARLILMTGGVTGRLASLNDVSSETSAAQEVLKRQVQMAADVLGFEDVTCLDFPDNRMDTVSRMDLAHALTPYIQSFKPDVVFTHHPGDYNWDHGLTFDAVMMAARPNPPDHTPSEIFTFEVPSSTERAWQSGDRTFMPNKYVDVTRTIDQKKLAMSYYSHEYREYPHPRSIEGLEYLSRRRGNEVGFDYAEAFHLIRKLER